MHRFLMRAISDKILVKKQEERPQKWPPLKNAQKMSASY